MKNVLLRKQVISWGLYDFANSAYASVVPYFLFPLFYKVVILDNSPNADLWWGITVGISVLLAGFMAPVLGAWADKHNKRKTTFITSSLFAIFGTAALVVSGKIGFLPATILFVFTHVSFHLSLNMYDSMLSDVSSAATRGTVSGFGWALGYGGGILATLIVYPFIKGGAASQHFALSYLVVAAIFLVFALPAFIVVKEIRSGTVKDESSFASVVKTIKQWRERKRILLFLIAFYFLTEGIVTISYFSSLYANTTLHLTTLQIAFMFIITQVVAIPATIIAGKYSDRVGYKSIMLFALFVWIVATILLSTATTATMLYVVGVITGLVVGASQATARAWYTRIIPTKQRSQFFGFNAFASKISATIGPVLFGVVSVATKSQRIAVMTVLVYFVISGIIFLRLRDPVKSLARA